MLTQDDPHETRIDEREPSASRDELKHITTLASRLVQVELELDDLARRDKELTAERHDLRTRLLPDAMSACGMTSVGVGNVQIRIEPQISASLPKDPADLQRAVEFLVDHGEGGGVKRKLEIDLPKGDAVMEERIVESLTNVAPALRPRVSPSIHHQTYLAIARRLVTSGASLPECLGIFVGRIARVVEKD